MIAFGAKAFHFSQVGENSFKQITKANFASIAQSSNVFISFGEIDCRPNEGFISAAKKLNKPLEDLISDTVIGYLKWFSEQNKWYDHELFFFNIPAPFYDTEHSPELNSEVLNIVLLFNAAIKKYVPVHGFKLVDVCQFTTGCDGFSNGLFHVDNRHLGAKAISEIEQQLN